MNNEKRTRAKDVVQVMGAMFDLDPTLTGKELSARLGLSVSRLARLFKQEMGISMVEYRNRLRFKRLFELLAAQHDRRPTLRQAARAAGFGSYAHFHRLFRARWHMGPRQGFRAGVTPEIEAVNRFRAPRVREMVAESRTHLSSGGVDVWLEHGDQRIESRLRQAVPAKTGNA